MEKRGLEIFSLQGKTAVVTGGAGFLGRAMALGLGKAGAAVAICDLRAAQEAATNLVSEGVRAAGYYVDVLQKEALQRCCQEVLSEFGAVDILVNAAGGNQKEATTSADLSFFDLPVEALQKVINLNLFGGAILPCQVFGPLMAQNKTGGSIINISSMNAFRPLTKIPGYSAAKAAVSNFTQWLAAHLALEYNQSLRVNAIAPGFFLSDHNRYLLTDDAGNLTERGKTIIRHTPAGRLGQPEDLIGAVVWLASDASAFVNGVVLPVDGGFNAFAGV